MLYDIDATQVKPGRYTMLYIDRFNEIVQKILQGRHPNATLAVFNVCIGNAQWESGQVMLSRQELADRAHITPDMASRCMSLLVEYGAIWRHGKGRATEYYCDPNVGWSSSKHSPVQGIMIEAERRIRADLEKQTEEPPLPL